MRRFLLLTELQPEQRFSLNWTLQLGTGNSLCFRSVVLPRFSSLSQENNGRPASSRFNLFPLRGYEGTDQSRLPTKIYGSGLKTDLGVTGRHAANPVVGRISRLAPMSVNFWMWILRGYSNTGLRSILITG